MSSSTEDENERSKNKRLENIKRKIRALLNMTVARGASEEEAMSAAGKAAEFMAEWDLEFDDLDGKKKEDLHYRKVKIDPAISDALWKIAAAIGQLCSCRVWTSSGNRGVTFFGEEIDSSIAEYLMDLCARSVVEATRSIDRNEYSLYRANVRSRKRLGFIDGMSKRLAVRIKELSWKRHKTTGNALVPVKMDRLDEALKMDGMGFSNFSVHQSIIDPEAQAVGRATADEIPLARGLSKSSADAEIEEESDGADGEDAPIALTHMT